MTEQFPEEGLLRHYEPTSESADSHRERLTPEDQVDQLLDETAIYFELAEHYWSAVSDIYKAGPTEEDLKVLYHKRLEVNTATGKMEEASRTMRPINRKVARETKTLSPRQALGHLNQFAYDAAKKFRNQSLDIYHGLNPDLYAARLIGENSFTQARVAVANGTLDPPAVGWELASEGDRMLNSFIAAFALQDVCMYRLGQLFSNVELVPALVERIEELAIEAQYSPPEYPGLLEVLATHMAVAEAAKKPNLIQTALQQAASSEYTEVDFAHDLLTNGWLVSEKKIRNFTAQIAAAQMMASAVRVHFPDGVQGDKEIAQLVASYFGSKTEGVADPAFAENWRNVYEKRLHDGCIAQAKGVKNLLKPYERSGRQRSNLRALVPDDETTTNNRKPSKRQSKKETTNNDTQAAQREVTNISQESEYPPVVFNILNHTGGDNNRYTLQEVGDVDAIMEHPLVTKFLAQYDIEDIRETLKTYLEDIARYPRGHEKIVSSPFALAGQTAKKSDKLRRYSPNDAASSREAAANSNQLLKRIRINYAVTTIDGVIHIGLQQINLRDSQTYKEGS